MAVLCVRQYLLGWWSMRQLQIVPLAPFVVASSGSASASSLNFLLLSSGTTLLSADMFSCSQSCARNHPMLRRDAIKIAMFAGQSKLW